MKRSKRSIYSISQRHNIDPDALLVALWYFNDEKFNYLKNEKSEVKLKDLKAVNKTAVVRFDPKQTYSKKSSETEAVKLDFRDFDFSKIGKYNDDISYLNEKDIISIYTELVKDFNSENDPIEPSGVKDQNLLLAAITHPQTGYEFQYKYPTTHSAAAALMYAMTHNHPFYNGNKRTAVVAMLVFLERHNIMLMCSEDDLYKVSLSLADHKLVKEEFRYPDAEVFELAQWLNKNSKSIEKGERVVTLKKLRQILSHFGCEILENGKVVRIIRERKSYWFIPRDTERKLVSSQYISNSITDGREVSKTLIRSIRTDLQLTDQYGVDSEVFYAKSPYTVSDFINKYKSLLRRLSKV